VRLFSSRIGGLVRRRVRTLLGTTRDQESEESGGEKKSCMKRHAVESSAFAAGNGRKDQPSRRAIKVARRGSDAPQAIAIVPAMRVVRIRSSPRSTRRGAPPLPPPRERFSHRGGQSCSPSPRQTGRSTQPGLLPAARFVCGRARHDALRRDAPVQERDKARRRYERLPQDRRRCEPSRVGKSGCPRLRLRAGFRRLVHRNAGSRTNRDEPMSRRQNYRETRDCRPQASTIQMPRAGFGTEVPVSSSAQQPR